MKAVQGRRLYVVEIVYEDGNDVEIYAYRRDADARVREVRREAKDQDDPNTHAIAYPARVR